MFCEAVIFGLHFFGLRFDRVARALLARESLQFMPGISVPNANSAFSNPIVANKTLQSAKKSMLFGGSTRFLIHLIS